MKRIFLLPLFVACSIGNAEEREFKNPEAMDRLEQLSRTLGQGEYTHPDDIEITASTSITTSPFEGLDVKKWHTDCKKDRFNGSKICSLYKFRGDISVFLINGRHSVYVGSNHYPRSESAIKIDNNATIYGLEGIIKTPLKVIEQMKRGKIAYTRYVEWPYDYNKDGETTLEGFQDAFDEMNRQYKQL